MTGRLSILTVAGARSSWSTAVTRWAATGALPVEVVRCLSPGQVHAQLQTGRSWSALLADAALQGVDRDLVAAAAAEGCPTILVDEVGGRDGSAFGAATVLGAPFSRDELLGVLERHGRRLATGRTEVVPEGPSSVRDPGTFVAVTGTGGSGTTTVAAALAQGLARPTRGRRRGPSSAGRDVVLADLCRSADQAIVHDARVLVPGLREVVDAYATATPTAEQLRAQTFAIEDRGYRLLLGLRRPFHWTTLGGRAIDAALDGLRTAFAVTVADLDPDVEGEGEGGVKDVEDRHHLTRAALDRADLVLVTGEASTLGCAKLVRLVGEVLQHGVDPRRVLLVLPRSPKASGARGEVARTLADLLRGSVGAAAERIAPPLGLPDRPVDRSIRDATPLPAPLPEKLAAAVDTVLGRVGTRAAPVGFAPVPIRPGELGLAVPEPDVPPTGGGPGGGTRDGGPNGPGGSGGGGRVWPA